MVLSVPEQRWVTPMRLDVVYDAGRSSATFTAMAAERVGLEERQSIAATATVIASSASSWALRTAWPRRQGGVERLMCRHGSRFRYLPHVVGSNPAAIKAAHSLPTAAKRRQEGTVVAEHGRGINSSPVAQAGKYCVNHALIAPAGASPGSFRHCCGWRCLRRSPPGTASS